MSACVDDGVHLLVEANGAFSIFPSRGQLRGSQGGRSGGAERRAGSSHWKEREYTEMKIIWEEEDAATDGMF